MASQVKMHWTSKSPNWEQKISSFTDGLFVDAVSSTNCSSELENMLKEKCNSLSWSTMLAFAEGTLESHNNLSQYSLCLGQDLNLRSLEYDGEVLISQMRCLLGCIWRFYIITTPSKHVSKFQVAMNEIVYKRQGNFQRTQICSINLHPAGENINYTVQANEGYQSPLSDSLL